jgi:hypothetical protein
LPSPRVFEGKYYSIPGGSQSQKKSVRENGYISTLLSLHRASRSAILCAMSQKSRTPAKELESGQIWRMQDSQLEVGLVGKHLVHYKLIKGETKRTPTSLSPKKTVETFLRQKRAVLVHG